MKSFILHDLHLLSLSEKRGRTFQFDPKTTIIKGVNHTGKSSLLKSIYRCFGAESCNVHSQWRTAQVIGVATFSVDGARYSILQTGTRYAMFDAGRKLIRRFRSVTNELGPYLAGLLDFRLKLTDKKNQVQTPPPAFLFLPFYVDQDGSWVKNWAAFRGLGQFDRWQTDLAQYHAGIRPNQYYLAKGDYHALREQLAPLEEKRNVIRKVLVDLQKKLHAATFDIDIDRYREEVKQILVACDGLKKKEEELKQTLVRLYSQKTVAEAHIALAKQAAKDLSLDYEYAAGELSQEAVECPLCGTVHSNTFAERLAIAQDEDRCHELLVQLNEEVAGTDADIERQKTAYADVGSEIARINEILATKQGEVKLRDIIESEGRKEVQNLLREDIAGVERNLADLDRRVQDAKTLMQSFERRERSRQITREFREAMQDSVSTLGVPTLNVGKLYVQSRITENGAALPRALLAYYYSFLKVMRNHSSSAFCPIVIDSPNQQDQDTGNNIRILTYLRDERPRDSQLILAFVSDFGVEFEGLVYELTEKYNLLSTADYERVFGEVKVFLDQAA